MAAALEIEVATVLRGPLAERLVADADAAGKEPVNHLADMMERALSDDGATLKECKKLKELRAAHEQLKKRREGTLPFATAKFEAEAARRGTTAVALMAAVLNMVANDGLFAAVLDN